MIINMNGAKAPETPSPVMQEKTVTPETLPTVIGADEGYDGLSQVTVNPDADLKAENIKRGTDIFGVIGTYGDNVKCFEIVTGFGSYGYSPDPVDGKYSVAWVLDFSESDKQYCTLKPDSVNGMDLTVNNTNMYANRPPFLLSKYIPKNISWMGISGTAPIHLNETNVIQSDYTLPLTIETENKYLELTDRGVTMSDYFPVTYANIRIPRPNNLTAENIKAGVTIAGVEGTYEAQPSEANLETVVTTPVSFPTVVTPSTGYDGLSRVTVHSPDNLTAENIKAGVSIAGITGTYEGSGSGGDVDVLKIINGDKKYSNVDVSNATELGTVTLTSNSQSFQSFSYSYNIQAWDSDKYYPTASIVLDTVTYLDSSNNYTYSGTIDLPETVITGDINLRSIYGGDPQRYATAHIEGVMTFAYGLRGGPYSPAYLLHSEEVPISTDVSINSKTTTVHRVSYTIPAGSREYTVGSYSEGNVTLYLGYVYSFRGMITYVWS